MAAASSAGSNRALDVLVSGAGIVGLATMRALQLVSRQRPAPLRLRLVDKGPRPQPFPSQPELRPVGSIVRTVALTPASSCVLNALGVWDSLGTKHPYYRMAVRHEQANAPSTAPSSSFLSSLLGPASSAPLIEFTDLDAPLGHITSNDDLQWQLLTAIEESQRAEWETLTFGCTTEGVTLPARDNVAGPLVTGTLQPGGEGITAALLVASEGAHTAFRAAVGSPVLRHDYHQSAFVCSVETEMLGDGNPCCFQNFFLDGSIVAYLPTGPSTANIVFSTAPAFAEKLRCSDSDSLVRELNSRLSAMAPRDIPKIRAVVHETNDVTKRAVGAFPLALSVATQPASPRCVLVGDSAHGIHPMAGQGLNLGLYDVCVLADLLHKALESGSDIGSLVDVGQPLAGAMLAHTGPVIAAMEAIKLLATAAPALSCVGMQLVNRLPYATREIAKAAGGELFLYMNRDSFLLGRQGPAAATKAQTMMAENPPVKPADTPLSAEQAVDPLSRLAVKNETSIATP